MDETLRFLLVSVLFGAVAYLAKKYIPEPVIGSIVVILVILIWIVKYALPFIGATF